MSERSASRTAKFYIFGGFSIVLMANSALIYFALNTWTGLETEQHFVKGLAYNSNLEGARKQQSQGWQMQLNTTFDGPTSGVIGIDFTGPDGKPMTDLHIKVFAIRPTHEGYDREFPATPVGSGTYQSNFALPLPGVWDLHVVAQRGDQNFQQVERIVTP